jgi:hypothetical protein
MTYKTLPAPSPNNEQIREYTDAAKRGLDGHFVIKTENGWAVRKASAARSSIVSPTKADAVKRAREIAKNQRTDVYVFDTQGRLTSQYSE